MRHGFPTDLRVESLSEQETIEWLGLLKAHGEHARQQQDDQAFMANYIQQGNAPGHV